MPANSISELSKEASANVKPIVRDARPVIFTVWAFGLGVIAGSILVEVAPGLISHYLEFLAEHRQGTGIW